MAGLNLLKIKQFCYLQICTLRPLADVYALVRDVNNIQLFLIEYKNGLYRSYITNDRYASQRPQN